MTVALLGERIFPPNARLDLARQEKLFIPDPALGALWSFTVPGEFYLIPYYVGFAIATGNIVAARAIYLQIMDADGAEILAMPSPSTQLANTGKTYRWIGSTSASYFLDAAPLHESVAPLPPIIMEPGMTLQVSAVNFLAVDQISGIRIISIHVPTGPEIAPGRGAFVYPLSVSPTPLAA